MTRYRVSATLKSGKRIATSKFWMTRREAQKYADETNATFHKGANARVVLDSEKIRSMIP